MPEITALDPDLPTDHSPEQEPDAALTFEAARTLLLEGRMRRYHLDREVLQAQCERVETASRTASERVTAQRATRAAALLDAQACVQEYTTALAELEAQTEQMLKQAGSIERRFDIEPALAEADAVVYAMVTALQDEGLADGLLTEEDPPVAQPLSERERMAARQAARLATTQLEAGQFALLEAQEALEQLAASDQAAHASETAALAQVEESAAQARAVLDAQVQKLEAQYGDVLDEIQGRTAALQAAAAPLLAQIENAFSAAAVQALAAEVSEPELRAVVETAARTRVQELAAGLRSGRAYADNMVALPEDCTNALAIVTPHSQVHIFVAAADGVPVGALYAFANRTDVCGRILRLKGTKAAMPAGHGWAAFKSYLVAGSSAQPMDSPSIGRRARSRNGRADVAPRRRNRRGGRGRRRAHPRAQGSAQPAETTGSPNTMRAAFAAAGVGD